MDRWTPRVKITPSHQTLILANERGSAGTSAVDGLALPGAGPTSSAAAGVDLGVGDSVLKRVTIVTSHPDSTMVYLQADYAADDSVVATIPAVAPASLIPRSVGGSAARAAQAAALPSTTTGLKSHAARGIDLYASTQNILTDTLSSAGAYPFHIDVHA